MSNLKEIDPFIRIQVESLNWTGYDATLIDEVVARGNELNKQNQRLSEDNKKMSKDHAIAFWKNFGQSVGFGLVLAAFVLFFALGFVSINEGQKREGFAAGVQYAESYYKQTTPSKIKVTVNFPRYIYTSIDKTFDSKLEAEAFEKIKNGEIYTIYEEK